jgi:TRAP-type C4-dicarboxylate transport system permease small subunit
MIHAFDWARRRCENIAAGLLAIMFLAFMAQIAARYLFNLPTGWMNELSIVMWLWLVLFGSAFVVREPDEMRFDLVYGSVRDRTRRGMALTTAVALVVLFGMSLPAVVDFILFMKVQDTAYLNIRFDWLFAIYIVFAVAMIARYLWIGFDAIRGRAPEAFDPTKASSGV